MSGYPKRGCIIDMGDDIIRADAIRSGIVWSGPMAAQIEACKDIEAGRVPMPDPASLPEQALRLLDALAIYPRRPWIGRRFAE